MPEGPAHVRVSEIARKILSKLKPEKSRVNKAND